MGTAKKTRKFAQTKRVIGQRDARLKKNQEKNDLLQASKKAKDDGIVRSIPQAPTSLFFTYNTALRPPYQILLDTNFLSHTIQHKLSLVPSLMDCLYASVKPTITTCCLAELEKLGPKYRLALRIAKDPAIQVLDCTHKGTYADDCIVDRAMKSRIYIVATNDRDLKRRVRKVPGVPIVSVARGRYVVERLVDAPERERVLDEVNDLWPIYRGQNVRESVSRRDTKVGKKLPHAQCSRDVYILTEVRPGGEIVGTVERAELKAVTE
ncbi:uncharacterized protein KY384_009018 [Bacidia gigantensis]|uniref:uncharacterized protein n=1 Tax=Bacidia gigantensis TaxID=2732470 RepID=UPI001D04BA07|nr:uncharacterized protein KY384_009018 [Bacidia gigantensis]KAG8525374.1 hypothetical protein KY384_009018 [Bacidia gigantensis]